MPTAREHMPVVALGGRSYVPGGRFETIEHNTDLHEVYDLVTNSWVEAAPLLTPRSGTAGAALDGRVLVFGGQEPAGIIGKYEVYGPVTNAWKEFASLPTPRYGFGAATMGSAGYLPAGAPVVGGDPGWPPQSLYTVLECCESYGSAEFSRHDPSTTLTGSKNITNQFLTSLLSCGKSSAKASRRAYKSWSVQPLAPA